MQNKNEIEKLWKEEIELFILKYGISKWFNYFLKRYGLRQLIKNDFSNLKTFITIVEDIYKTKPFTENTLQKNLNKIHSEILKGLLDYNNIYIQQFKEPYILINKGL